MAANLQITPEAISLLAARNSLAAYAVAQVRNYDLAKHTRIIIDHLEALERGEIKQLMCFCPPRAGKSLLCSQLFSAHWGGKHPTDEIVLSSYSQELIEDHSIKCRNFMASEFHQTIFPEARLDDSFIAKHDFRLKAGGAVRAVGRGASLTGRGFSLGIIDDLYKDKEQARSETERRKDWDWFNNVFMTRRTWDARVLIVATRWDTDDVMGRELAERSSEWTVLELPAISMRDEGWRNEGEALWPERYPLEWLEKMRDRLSRDDWMALYQQRPTRDGDETCFSSSWVRFFKPKPDGSDAKEMNGVMIGDPANKRKKGRDRTGIWIVGLGPDQNYYFFDGCIDRLGLSDRWKTVKQFHQKWNSVFRRLHVYWEQFGQTADIEYFEERMKMENYRFHIEEIGSNQVSKEQRIRDFGQGICKDLRVYWNEVIQSSVDGNRVNLTKWLMDNEWAKYPAVRHDDGLDSASYINDARFKKQFPKPPNRAGDIDAMMAAWKKRRQGISPLGQ